MAEIETLEDAAMEAIIQIGQCPNCDPKMEKLLIARIADKTPFMVHEIEEEIIRIQFLDENDGYWPLKF